jgi:hypothetical protein
MSSEEPKPNNTIPKPEVEEVSFDDIPEAEAAPQTELEDTKGEETEAEETVAVPETVADAAAEESNASPTGSVQLYEEFDINLFVQLGDTIQIKSKKYKNIAERIKGVVYYRSHDRIIIKSLDSSTLYEYDLEEDDKKEIYKADQEVTEVNVIEKRAYGSFVEQNGFYVKQIIEAINLQEEDSEPVQYTVLEVNRKKDLIIVKHEEEEPVTIEFNFIGIKPEEEFQVLRDAGIQPEEDEVENEEEDEEPSQVIEFVGSVEITLPERYREAEVYEQRIPDSLQKIDAFNDFLTELSDKQKNDPRQLRKIRLLIELLFYLKQATVAYNEDGSKKGIRAVSVSSLTDLVDSTPVPLGRPVLSVTKKLYTMGDAGDKDEEDEDDEKGNIFQNSSVFNIDFDTELQQIIEPNVQPISTGAREWSNKRKFLEDYLSPWIQNTDDDSDYLWNAIKDSDFFREIVPELDENNQFERDLAGYVASHKSDQGPIFDDIAFGMERALETIYRKGKTDKQVFIPEEKATVISYLLFPLRAAPYLGITRCNLLALDSGSSQIAHKTMKMLLREYGSPVEGGMSRNIQRFDASGDTIGNIQLHDYINGIYMITLNVSETFYILQHYGIDNIELNIPTFDVLIAKMSRHQKKFISTIAIMRNKLREIQEAQPNKFIELSFLEFLERETMLKDEIENFKKFNPTLIESDVALMSYILKKYPNYVQVSAGKNGLLIAKAKQDTFLANYILQEKIKQLIQENTKHVVPNINKCKHVSALVSIRRKYDDIDRMKDLTAFFKKYQGTRVANWIHCNVCDEKLMCIHERLQLQGFLNPIEKPSIDKEIILKFSGGQFQGRYICRACGQQIREFDFDNNMEFDDQGRPKSGNAVVEDEDDEEDFQQKLNIMISAPVGKSDYKMIQLSSEAERTYYKVIRELCYFMKIDLKQIQMKNILDTVVFMMQHKVRTFEKYERSRKAAEAKGIANYDPYDVYYAQNIIGFCAAYLLIEIQCSIPSYNIYSKINEVVYTMTGYPLDTAPENQESIDYMAYAIVACLKHADPWNQAGIMEIPKGEQLGYVKYILKEKVDNAYLTNTVQQNLYAKRRYNANKDLQKVVKEILPISFLPEQIQTKEVLVPEVAAANNAKSRVALVNYWIRKAHHAALDSAIKIKGSTVSEITCCSTNITNPGAMWNTDDFTAIDIGLRALQPKQINMLLTYYKPRLNVTELIKADEKLYYRLFLKCCFTGKRAGHSHEPGLTYKCAWCGFQFPGNPKCIDSDTEGKAALTEVKMDNDSFYELLDKVHTLHIVPSVEVPTVTKIETVLNSFANITNHVIDNWGALISKSVNAYTSLAVDSTREDELRALTSIGKAVRELEEPMKEKFGEEFSYVRKMIELPWANFFDVLQTYFIIYFQRMISGFSPESLVVPKELVMSLSKKHVDEDLTHIIKSDFGFEKPDAKLPYKALPDLLSLLQIEFKSVERSKARVTKEATEAYQMRIVGVIQSFIEQLSELLKYKYTISFRQIRSPDLLILYIKKLILYASFSTLLAKQNGNVLFKLVIQQLHKFYKERLSSSPEEIKNMIAMSDEVERVHVVKEFDILTDEERQIEKVKKMLGIGKWAVGGTKLIYAYDADYYDLERQRRLDAGIMDFPGLGMNDEPEGREVDDLGFAEGGEEDGYDFNQHEDDDNE